MLQEIELKNRKMRKWVIQKGKSPRVELLNFGARIQRIWAKDGNGIEENILLSYAGPEQYELDSIFLGAVVGPVAGRIKKGLMTAEGSEHTLTTNEGRHHLHGGDSGFGNVYWEAEPGENEQQAWLRFSISRTDGTDGYPGDVKASVTYIVEAGGDFTVEYEGESDTDTWFSPTQHMYINLSGNNKRPVTEQYAEVHASDVLELDRELIPTGELLPTAGTPFELNGSKPLGEHIDSSHEQVRDVAGGIDHFFILEEGKEPQVNVWDEASGRRLDIITSAPGAVVYTSNNVPEQDFEEGPKEKHRGICIETQQMPVDFAHLGKPTAYLNAKQHFKSSTIFRLSTR
ncbi:aldose epimerase family protein [Marinococcus luteus]|uniref:aldose epimerase family protein n=1 Tax=Marinococcus luteus TaxID=1122204 RepID=UPI002ACC9A0E|nr:aldose epimerase family protein [Marinococcus luteus]MDZ5784011.1 aldose epimerase family protein [Marinococcus luteus]